jgi:hypothetical protein
LRKFHAKSAYRSCPFARINLCYKLLTLCHIEARNAMEFGKSGFFGTMRDRIKSANKPADSAASGRSGLARTKIPLHRVEARIAAFLDGKTDGRDLLHALYDYVIDEPIPASMQALLNK